MVTERSSCLQPTFHKVSFFFFFNSNTSLFVLKTSGKATCASETELWWNDIPSDIYRYFQPPVTSTTPDQIRQQTRKSFVDLFLGAYHRKQFIIQFLCTIGYDLWCEKHFLNVKKCLATELEKKNVKVPGWILKRPSQIPLFMSSVFHNHVRTIRVNCKTGDIWSKN